MAASPHWLLPIAADRAARNTTNAHYCFRQLSPQGLPCSHPTLSSVSETRLFDAWCYTARGSMGTSRWGGMVKRSAAMRTPQATNMPAPSAWGHPPSGHADDGRIGVHRTSVFLISDDSGLMTGRGTGARLAPRSARAGTIHGEIGPLSNSKELPYVRRPFDAPKAKHINCKEL